MSCKTYSSSIAQPPCNVVNYDHSSLQETKNSSKSGIQHSTLYSSAAVLRHQSCEWNRHITHVINDEWWDRKAGFQFERNLAVIVMSFQNCWILKFHSPSSSTTRTCCCCQQQLRNSPLIWLSFSFLLIHLSLTRAGSQSHLLIPASLLIPVEIVHFNFRSCKLYGGQQLLSVLHNQRIIHRPQISRSLIYHQLNVRLSR